jgi:hypothetical protein
VSFFTESLFSRFKNADGEYIVLEKSWSPDPKIISPAPLLAIIFS